MNEENASAEYVHNFNSGYIVAHHLPQLGEQLAKAMKQFDKADGFADGQKQFQAERTLDRTPDWLRSDWRKGIDIGRDLSSGKEDVEKEL